MASTNFAAPVGEILDGKFRVTKEIGRGGMAAVYSAENIGIGKPVAVKILSEELTTSRTVNERFLREARAAAKIQSPYICEVYDVGTYQGRPFIVMELLEGESLYDKLSRERQLTPMDTARIAVQTAKGLKRAHEINVVHRDLKPENIFLTTGDDGGVHTKLVDFGLAKFYEPSHDQSAARLTKEGALFGTPAYMSPEQAKGMGDVDQRSDLWALGCIVFEMLTGRTVWDLDQGVAMILAQIAKSDLPQIRKYRPDLPPTFEAWFSKALARDVNQRFQTADEFATSLQAALTPPGTPPMRLAPADETSASFPNLAAVPGDRQETSGISHPQAPAPAVAPPPLPPVEATPRHTRRRWMLASSAFVIGGGIAGWFMLAQLGGVSARSGGQLAEAGPGAETVAEAQQLLTEGALDQSLKLLETSFEQTSDKAVRSLLSHLSAVKDGPTGDCKLRGIGHPRPFDSKSESSKLDLLATPEAILATWADQTSGQSATQARVTHLDGALRRVGTLSEVTPEATLARDPELFVASDQVGLLYWDFEGTGAGAYARLLDGEGKLVGAPVRLSSDAKRHPFYPELTKAPDGGYWTVWVEPSRDRVFDLYVRKLNAKLEPISDPVAVTGYATPTRGKTQTARPSIAALENLLVISYTLRQGNKQQVMVLRIPTDKATSGPGVKPVGPAQAAGDEESDRFLGQAVMVSEKPNNHDQSTVRCGKAGCFIAWDDAQSAAHLALMQADGTLTWTRSLGSATSRPNIAVRDGRAVLSWYEDKRVLVAPLSASGPAKPSVIGRVAGVLNQPPPSIVGDPNHDDRWYVSWLTYETATQEPFVARIDCDSP